MPPMLDVGDEVKAQLALAVAKGNISEWLQFPWARKKGITDAAGLCAHFGDSYEQMLAFGQQLLENVQLYGHATWYGWRWANWGTMWNVDGKGDVELKRKSPTHAILEFETAWTPPIPAIKKLAVMLPQVKIRLRYSEPAMGVEGKLVLAGGVEASHNFRNTL